MATNEHDYDCELLTELAHEAAKRNSKRHNYDDMVSEAYLIMVERYHDDRHGKSLRDFLLNIALNWVNRKNREDYLVPIPIASRSRKKLNPQYLSLEFLQSQNRTFQITDIQWIKVTDPLQQTIIRALLAGYTLADLIAIGIATKSALYSAIRNI